MHATRLIVDGYSLLHQDPRLAARVPAQLEAARDLLVRSLEEIAGTLAESVTVVFDGRDARAGEALTSSVVEILFSPGHLTADSVIERIVADASRPEAITVVTSDRAECDTVTAAGAQVVSCRQFMELCQRQKARDTQHSGKARGAKPFRLGDRFPES